MAYKKAQILPLLALGMGAALSSTPAHADEISDLKAMVKELKNQVVEERAQIKDLKAQLGDLNTQVTSQKQQVTDQAATVQTQGAVLQQVTQQQQAIEQKQAAAPAPVLAADAANPGYFAVPGTNTAVKIGGYVKLDVTDDVSNNMSHGGYGGPAAASKTAFDPTAIALSGSPKSHQNGQLNFSAQESRLNFSTLTKTDSLGDIQTVVEGDFYNYYGGNLFRLRHAYISAAGWTVGQTWSTFTDLDTVPETLDFNGPVGQTFSRHPLIRYSAALPVGKLDMAVESPSSNIDNHTVNASSIEQAPDVVARYTVDPSWGHVAVAGIGRYLSDNDGVAHGAHGSKIVGGVMGGLGVKTFGKDMVVFQAETGNGIGDYLEQGEETSAVILANGAIKPINAWGGLVGYTHFWTDALRSTVAGGYGHFSTPTGDTMQPISAVSSLHANLIWSPVTDMDVGVEYIFGRVEDSVYYSGANTTATTGNASRIQGSVKYAF